MKIRKTWMLIMSALMLTISSCHKDDSTPATSHPYGTGMGKYSFYVVQSSSPRSTYPISIVVDNLHVGDISYVYNPGGAAPDCDGGSGVVSYVGSPGYHTFKATGANGSSVTGSVNIVADICSLSVLNN